MYNEYSLVNYDFYYATSSVLSIQVAKRDLFHVKSNARI